jgi:hypothetical protein
MHTINQKSNGDFLISPGFRTHVQVNPNNGEGDEFSKLEWIAKIDEFLSNRKEGSNGSSRYDKIKKIFSEYDSKDLIQDSINRINLAFIDVLQIMAVINTHSEIRTLPKKFKAALFNDEFISKSGKSPGRDSLFEYYVGARFKAAGCKTADEEPDLMCTFQGIKFGVAVKRFNLEKMESHLRKARDQIRNTGKPGIIAVDITANDIFNSKVPFIGSRDEYTKYVHKWMDEKFTSMLKRKVRQIGLNTENTPSILGFHLGSAFDHNASQFYHMSHFTSFNTMEKPPPTIESILLTQKIFLAIENLRRTLPESNILL